LKRRKFLGLAVAAPAVAPAVIEGLATAAAVAPEYPAGTTIIAGLGLVEGPTVTVTEEWIRGIGGWSMTIKADGEIITRKDVPFPPFVSLDGVK
jgi:hypothetical protein